MSQVQLGLFPALDQSKEWPVQTKFPKRVVLLSVNQTSDSDVVFLGPVDHVVRKISDEVSLLWRARLPLHSKYNVFFTLIKVSSPEHTCRCQQPSCNCSRHDHNIPSTPGFQLDSLRFCRLSRHGQRETDGSAAGNWLSNQMYQYWQSLCLYSSSFSPQSWCPPHSSRIHQPPIPPWQHCQDCNQLDWGMPPDTDWYDQHQWRQN